MDKQQQPQKSRFREFYEKNNQKLIIIPILTMLLSITIITIFYLNNNDIMEKDVTLKGGITATITTAKPINLQELQGLLTEKFGDAIARQISEFGTDRQIGITVEVVTQDEAQLKQLLSQHLNLDLTEENYSVEIIGSSLGAAFYKQMLTAILIAFILMAIVVFFIYRSLVPSLNVISAAFWDITIALALADLFHMRISTSGISAFLLLIGYSIDTDILMTTRVLKRREGSMMDRLFSSINTGLVMTATTMVALLAGLLISESSVIREMFTIMLFGLIADIIMTYCMNAPILIRYATKRGIT